MFELIFDYFKSICQEDLQILVVILDFCWMHNCFYACLFMSVISIMVSLIVTYKTFVREERLLLNDGCYGTDTVSQYHTNKLRKLKRCHFDILYVFWVMANSLCACYETNPNIMSQEHFTRTLTFLFALAVANAYVSIKKRSKKKNKNFQKMFILLWLISDALWNIETFFNASPMLTRVGYVIIALMGFYYLSRGFHLKLEYGAECLEFLGGFLWAIADLEFTEKKEVIRWFYQSSYVLHVATIFIMGVVLVKHKKETIYRLDHAHIIKTSTSTELD